MGAKSAHKKLVHGGLKLAKKTVQGGKIGYKTEQGGLKQKMYRGKKITILVQGGWKNIGGKKNPDLSPYLLEISFIMQLLYYYYCDSFGFFIMDFLHLLYHVCSFSV